MIEQFVSYVNSHSLVEKNELTLLAVSGGVDSVVLCDLYAKAKFPFVIAHCNFTLRGEASDADEAFVKQLAKRYKVSLFTKRFKTQEYAKSNKCSIEMAAREIRFTWFNELLHSQNIKSVATAHHKDDQVETFMINLIRGCGIAGLHGIAPRNGEVIHPLLFSTRGEISNYAAEQQIMWREDASNRSLKHLRNQVRHQLLPVFKMLEPSFVDIMEGNIDRLRDTERVFRFLVNQQRTLVEKKDGRYMLYSIAALKQLSPLPLFLYEFLSSYGFNGADIKDIVLSIKNSKVGNVFLTERYQLIHDREYLVVAPKRRVGTGSFLINRPNSTIVNPIQMQFVVRSIEPGLEIPKEPAIATLDADKISFPLALRKWQDGDSFYPFGLNGTKKISDFFTDLKLSFRQKEEAWLLCSGDQILWVVGYRIDDRFRITPGTKNALFIKLEKDSE